MVTRSDATGRVWFAAAMVVASAFGAAGRAAASDLSVTLSAQSGNALIQYAGGSSALDGDNISIDSVTGLNTPGRGPSATLPVVNGMLNFDTGAFLGGDPAGTSWKFGGGGNLLVAGTIPALGINTNTELLKGTFSDPTLVSSLNGGDLKMQGGAFLSVVDPTLASYFGLPTGGVLYSGGLSTLFRAVGASPSAFSSSKFTGGTMTMSPAESAVPEPGSLLVFGTLAACGAAGLRKKRA